MKKKLLFCLLLTVSVLFGSKVTLQKSSVVNHHKIHPYTQLLNQIDPSPISKGKNYEKLLVILVDFEEETIDDPLTTGNGKFLLEADPSYKTTIGSPPHNQLYFETNLEALRYYYLAVSNESYNLQYDVYPKTKAAYTLPHSMGYYNPVGLGSEVFLQRMEEYFKTSFETADHDDPEIDFSAYGHYMIIHAGSDWQHDVLGDTPSDIPSFFINVGSGKEAFVDDGFAISHACNVPSTISQDFGSSIESEVTYYSGYGALNSVIAHEFGHSLGLVDLYNVYNFQPMVGVFDIMDSGGNGVLLDVADDGGYVMVEGALPALPGAFSRALLFGDYYLQTGLMKEVNQIDLADDITVCASSKKQATIGVKPSIVKLPLNSNEYLLLENRSVDPDGDGGTAVHGELDNRVIMYPVPTDPNQNERTYEYDYLLSSFIASNGASIGGGIMVWHVNNDIIYNQGSVAADGTFYSNFENNSVNTRINSRGVKVIEADGLPDIGNTSSYYWTGTAYEYFHKHKPILDVNGSFVSWSQSLWKDRLNAISSPALNDDLGNPAFYGLQINSDPQALMNIRITTSLFDHSQVIDTQVEGSLAAPVINSSLTNSPELPIITPTDISLYTYSIQAHQPDFTDLFGATVVSLPERKFPLVSSNISTNNFKELVWCGSSELRILEYANDLMTERTVVINDSIRTTPLFMTPYLWVASQNHLTRVSANNVEPFPFSDIRCLASMDNLLIALNSSQLTLYNPSNLDIVSQYTLPETCGAYEPVIYVDSASTIDPMIFVMSNSGNIYKIQASQLTRIFTNPSQIMPTQIGLTSFGTDAQKSMNTPTLFFGIGSKAYALKYDGSFCTGFPKPIDNMLFSSGRSLRSLQIQGESILLYPYSSGAFLAINSQGMHVAQFDLNNPESDEGYLWWNNPSASLYWIISGKSGKILINGSSGFAVDPIVWNGFRNGDNGVYESVYNSPHTDMQSFIAYVFPNPVRSHTCRVHVENTTEEIDLKVFDISGQLVLKHRYPINDVMKRDLEIDASNLSSGVYILVLKSGKNTKSIKFAVEK